MRYQAALHPDVKSVSGKELGKFLPDVPHAMEHLTHGFFKERSRSTILADGSLHLQLVEGNEQDLRYSIDSFRKTCPDVPANGAARSDQPLRHAPSVTRIAF